VNNLILNQLTEFIVIHILAIFLGLLVIKYKVKVNYTRKINHFFVFFLPYFLKIIFPFQETLTSQICIACVGLATLIIYLKPIRKRVRIIRYMFTAFDRPEDRPFTLKWLFIQYLATYLVAVPLWVLFKKYNHTEAVLIIILINAIGDGLAEPIGVLFGKHKYSVRAIFTSKLYTRSIEGSACVFLVAVIVLYFFKSYFTEIQFPVAIILVPIVATLAEAKSPHTLDSPFIFLFTGFAQYGVYLL
jgi:dolichol kinase